MPFISLLWEGGGVKLEMKGVNRKKEKAVLEEHVVLNNFDVRPFYLRVSVFI